VEEIVDATATAPASVDLFAGAPAEKKAKKPKASKKPVV